MNMLLLCLAHIGLLVGATLINPKPVLHTNVETDASKLVIDDDDGEQHYSLLKHDGEYLMLGARNRVLNVSAFDLRLQYTLDWPAKAQHQRTCHQYGKSANYCQNYVRLLIETQHDRILVCGTGAYRPRCREYARDAIGYSLTQDDLDGQRLVPFAPQYKSTYAVSNGAIFAATTFDLRGIEPALFRRPWPSKSGERELKSPSYFKFEDAQFVGSFAYGQYVYLFYREKVELELANENGHLMHARVARICGNDNGYAANQIHLGTMVTARLNCSLDGNPPFYFDELQSITSPIESSHTIYAAFTTGASALRMSAVCAYSVRAIDQVFDEGQFGEMRRTDHRWMPVPERQVPSPRPGQCAMANDGLTESRLALFLREHSLIFDAVQPIEPSPIIVDNSMSGTYTSITAAYGTTHHLIYIGTSDGRVLKINRNGHMSSSSQVFDDSTPVRVLRYIPQTQRVVALADHSVRAFARAHCSEIMTCGQCVAMRDAHCAYSVSKAKCVDVGDTLIDGDFLQSVIDGKAPLKYRDNCPSDPYSVVQRDAAIVDSGDQGIDFEIEPHYEVEVASSTSSVVVALIVLTAVVAASTAGFLLGWRWKKWKGTHARPEQGSSSTISSYYAIRRLPRQSTKSTANMSSPSASHDINNDVTLTQQPLDDAQHLNLYASPPYVVHSPLVPSVSTESGSTESDGPPPPPQHRLPYAMTLHRTGSQCVPNDRSIRPARPPQWQSANYLCTLPKGYKAKQQYV